MKIAIDWAYEKDLAVIVDGEPKKFAGIEKFLEFLKATPEKKEFVIEEGCLYEFKVLLSQFGDVNCIPGQFTKKARGRKQKSDEKDAKIIYCTPKERYIAFEGENKTRSYLSELIKQRDRLTEQKKFIQSWHWLYELRQKLNKFRNEIDKAVVDSTHAFADSLQVADKTIGRIDRQIERFVKNHLHEHPLIQNGIKIKGFGAVSLAKVICYAKDIARFKSIGSWKHFFGFCIHEGKKDEITLKRQKTKRNRKLIFQFYDSSIKQKNQYREMFRVLRDEKGMGFKQARNRVMTRICEDLFKMWKFGENYKAVG